MYLESKFALVSKTVSVTHFNRGSVLIDIKNFPIKWDSLNKRSKIINPSSNLWVDTKPLYINNLEKRVTIGQHKNIINYCCK